MADEKKDLGETSLGMQPNLAGLLCYFFGFITGLVFYLVEKKNKFVRFHAMQSIVVFGSFFVANLVLLVVPVLGVIIGGLLSLLSLVLWILLMIKAYQGEFFKLPIAGDIAEKNS
ncbi:MAG: DUF4870 domain-containing protein [Candidatus Omnitrophica bacterium]|nr:DUF4870 domain-containing protein [Candidatus Omnitrophota bacterium]